MKKEKTFYACQRCGFRSPKWEGKCPDCGEWSSFEEAKDIPSAGANSERSFGADRPVPITQVSPEEHPRIPTGSAEIDAILGGGIVIGSVILIGGDPGIGKSTILLQTAESIASSGRKVLYISAEESVKQTKLRADRLGAKSPSLFLASETNVDTIKIYAGEVKPAVMIVDSIQMVFRPDIPAAPGTVSQVRECASELVYFCKRNSICLFLVGHVTKEGSLAGPRTLEHLVDTVVYFEGDRFQSYRILRAVKNRFGATNEIGVFEMAGEGLVPVKNPSEMFLSRGLERMPGSVVFPASMGSRMVLVEIQALATPGVYGVPTRRVSGVDFNRAALLVAVLSRHCRLRKGKYMISDMDIFVNAVGGIQVDEPAADAAMACAIASNFLSKCLPPATAVIGEVGLAGELRSVTQIAQRVAEAAKMGYSNIIIPENGAKTAGKPKGAVIRTAKFLKDIVKMMEQCGPDPDGDASDDQGFED